MKGVDLFRLALCELRVNPVRSALCALSVAVGTGALLLIAGLGLFGQTQVEQTLQTLGVSGLSVYLDDRNGGNPLSAELTAKMEQTLGEVTSAMAIKAEQGTVRMGYTNEEVLFLGADERLREVMQLEVLYGSLITERQAQGAQAVAVVGDDLAQTLFGRSNIVGRELRLRIGGTDAYYTVCGVVKEQTGVLGGAVSAIAPHLVYIPYSRLAEPQEQVDQVFVQCAAGADLTAAGERIEQFLTERGQVGGMVRVQNMSGMVDTVRGIAKLCVGLFLAVGSITLCVAMIGVACSMLAAAHEKTGEIGILLALGAQRRDIRRLFLLQSALLGGIGGMAGLTAAGAALHGMGLSVPAGRYIAALLFLAALLCAALAGLAPAVRAAGLDPIEAMRK